MFCSKCGVQIPDDANFCFKCANPVTVSFNSQTVHAQPIEPTDDAKREEILNELKTIVQSRKNQPKAEKPQTVHVHQNSGVGAAITTIILLAVLGGGGFLLYQKHLEEQKSGLNIHAGKDGVSASWNFPSSTSTNLSQSNLPIPSPSKMNIDVPYSYSSETNSSVPNNSATCPVNSDSQIVNLRSQCDIRDCDNDSGTIAGKIENGADATLTSKSSVSF